MLIECIKKLEGDRGYLVKYPAGNAVRIRKNTLLKYLEGNEVEIVNARIGVNGEIEIISDGDNWSPYTKEIYTSSNRHKAIGRVQFTQLNSKYIYLNKNQLPTFENILKALNGNRIKLNTVFNLGFGIQINRNKFSSTNNLVVYRDKVPDGCYLIANFVGTVTTAIDGKARLIGRCDLIEYGGIQVYRPIYSYYGYPEQMVRDNIFMVRLLPGIKPNTPYRLNKSLWYTWDEYPQYIDKKLDIGTKVYFKGNDIEHMYLDLNNIKYSYTSKHKKEDPVFPVLGWSEITNDILGSGVLLNSYSLIY